MSKISYDDNEQILNFNDALIYGSDLKLVQSRTEWLNDACIHFYLNVLQNRLQQQQSPNSDNNQIIFMDPSVVSFFMHQCCDDEDFADFKAGTKFPKHGYCFIPVNDAMRSRDDGNYYWSSHSGTHWSLLVVVIIGKTNNNVRQEQEEEHRFEFWHFDSVANSGNLFAAQDIAKKLSKVVFSPSSHRSTSSTTNNDNPVVVVVQEAKNTPQQINGYDCGIHMLTAAKLFSTNSLNDRFVDLQMQERKLQEFVKENPDFCKLLRQEIVQEILDKASKSNQ